jgi:hypothetical protein
MEYNLVEIWLRKDPVRWVSGALAGLIAGVVAMGVAGFVSTSFGMEFWFPVKLMGSIVLGPYATEFSSTNGVLAGWAVVEILAMFLGAVYAHFTGTNAVGPLLAMGLVWGTFTWIFIWNLFMQSFKSISAVRVPSTATFPVCIAFGLALASVTVFDRMMRGSKR